MGGTSVSSFDGALSTGQTGPGPGETVPNKTGSAAKAPSASGETDDTQISSETSTSGGLIEGYEETK